MASFRDRPGASLRRPDRRALCSRREGARPGIREHRPLEYGFRAHRCAAPRNDDLSIVGSGYWGAQDRSVPVNSGSRPGAPLGGHITQAGPLLEDPVGVAAPAVDPLPPRAVPPAAPPPVAPDPPEAVLVLPPVRPVVPVPEAAPVLPPALPAVVPVVELVEDDVVVPVVGVAGAAPAVGVAVVAPAVGVAVVVDEFCMVGKAAAPP